MDESPGHSVFARDESGDIFHNYSSYGRGAEENLVTYKLLKPDETVVFSWITYKSRTHRDRVNKKVMADKRLAEMMNLKTLPFDAKRMIYGGFESLVKA